MKKNVGDLDQYIRIACGLFMVGYGIRRDSTTLLALGSMKVAEGVTRYCPVLDAVGISTTGKTVKKPGLKRVVKKMVEEF
ncbi:hypothetical protein GGQ84_001756 [Desulfitispora alkaliphila]|uniref:YgaP family membrane protein n=1 Tax=Desulfitispora alkaliphila TaxID=622674 RepID=UPI003D20604F